jgi:hypothetical protein
MDLTNYKNEEFMIFIVLSLLFEFNWIISIFNVIFWNMTLYRLSYDYYAVK